MAEKQSESDLLTRLIIGIDFVRENYDRFEDPEFELGFIGALNCIALELQKPDPIKAIENYICTHCEDIKNYIS